ncbi:unnamed protein product [Cunninghamella blakesleeana]
MSAVLSSPTTPTNTHPHHYNHNHHNHRIYQPLLSKSLITKKENATNVVAKYSYRTCPICSERLLVRIHGTFVYKWINLHFSTRHHEWMHVVVNLHED